ncbi:MAG: hypothetical protein J5582_15000 [Ruminococcus sp.]|uniref:Uncharacterized protein n=1 Tax=Ruminococcus albus TaxID=1264 RepID=A0A1I1NUA8_RUMAL|nr:MULTISPECIES: hypothetical protein [Ruminococcus]MBO4867846.1 hypothetical protein [Ruminococcus sp.]SFD01189.1 hypothetical protein SAMN02910406_02868 [Ruminococcus albus]
MSRSYKKFAAFMITDTKCRRRYRGKTLANRAVRRNEISGGKSAYKRLYDSWDICDVRIPMEDLTRLRVAWIRGDRWLHRTFDTLHEAEVYYKRKYYRK